MNEQTPRLSVSLLGPRSPHECTSCGSLYPDEIWQECDHHDKPEPIFLLLCKECAKRLIKPHPRLYIDHQRNEPIPGLMELCDNCVHRDGYACSQTKAHGGAGIIVKIPGRFTAHINMGSKGGRWMHLYSEPPRECSGRTVAERE